MVPFSQEVYGCVKYTGVPVTDSISASIEFSAPLSAVILRNTFGKACPSSSSIRWNASMRDLEDLSARRSTHRFLVFLSTMVSRTLSLSDFRPITSSISQCPNSSLELTDSGRCSMLRPSTRLRSRILFALVRRCSFCGKSMFLIPNSPSST